MSVKDKYKVLSVNSNVCSDWLLYKHYAKRIPQIIYSFGLYEGKYLIGVCTFGKPPSSNLAESICGKDYADIVLELNRLVVNDNLEKNVLSYFVSSCIKMLPKPSIVVSFSDANMGHHGYIYQSCNFIYTGKSNNTKQYLDKDGNEFHFRNIGHIQQKLNAQINIAKRIIDNLSDDLLKPEYLKVTDKNRFTGHCYVASETYYHLSPLKHSVYHIKHEGTTHWFLRDENNNVVDLTAEQFKSAVPYQDGKRGFFLTSEPSQRSQKLIEKVLKYPFVIKKERVDEDKIDRVAIASYLKRNKGSYTYKQFDALFGYKDTCSHWFRTDSGFAYPSVDDWKKLKDILGFENTYDEIMLNYKWSSDGGEIAREMGLKVVEILPKHRYLYFTGTKKDKKNILKQLKHAQLPYPKGENNYYKADFKPVTQLIMF